VVTPLRVVGLGRARTRRVDRAAHAVLARPGVNRVAATGTTLGAFGTTVNDLAVI